MSVSPSTAAYRWISTDGPGATFRRWKKFIRMFWDAWPTWLKRARWPAQHDNREAIMSDNAKTLTEAPAPAGDYEVTHSKSPVFYDIYERKGELKQQTHYCPGF